MPFVKNSFVNTLIELYRRIRFNRDATAMMDTNQAAVDIVEPSKPATTFMSLARELRDHIYEDLVDTKYRFDTYQILNGVPHFSEPPTLSEPDSGSERELRRLKEVPYEYCFPPPASLSILRTSSKVRDEALQVIYRKGTLLFVLNHPSQNPLSTTQSDVLIKHFKNVEICLDQVSILAHSISFDEMICARRKTTLLVHRLADCTSGGGTCTVTTYHFLNPQWITFCLMTQHFGALCVFKKVILRFGHSLRITDDDFPGSSAELAAARYNTVKWTRPLYDKIALDDDIRCLGPCEKNYDSEGFFCMVFYPKNPVDKGVCMRGSPHAINWSSD